MLVHVRREAERPAGKVRCCGWREVAPNGGNPTGFDEYYTYDGLGRLTQTERLDQHLHLDV